MRAVRNYNDSKEQTEIGSNFWISFTDIMSCLLLIFLFLLSINLVNSKKDTASPEAMRTEIRELSEKVAILEQENIELRADSKELRNKKRELAELKEKFDLCGNYVTDVIGQPNTSFGPDKNGTFVVSLSRRKV